MLGDSEWVELLSLLLKRLSEIGADEIVAEIRLAISARVVEDNHSIVRFGVSPSLYKDVGTTITRLPTPKEAFHRAIEVLRIRLETVPAMAKRTAELLERDPADIVWREEDKGYFFASSRQSISCADLMLPVQELQAINIAFDKLIRLLSSESVS